MSPTETGQLSSAARAQLASELRLVCMRIARRIRFEHSDGVAPHQLSALSRIEERPRTPGELAAVERVSAPSMTRTVHGLVEAGWVTRAADPQDGRQSLLSVTPAGHELLARSRQARDAWMFRRVEGLSAQECAVLAEATAILGRVAAGE